MSYVLVVLIPFENVKRGDMISNTALVEKILAGGNASFVVRLNAEKE